MRIRQQRVEAEEEHQRREHDALREGDDGLCFQKGSGYFYATSIPKP